MLTTPRRIPRRRTPRTRSRRPRRTPSTRAASSETDEAADADGSDEAPAEDPVETFKAKLRRQEGDWYVIHSYAGYENRVKANLETRIQTLDMEDYIFEIQVPMEEVVEIKNTTRKIVNRVRIPGYVLVRMDLTDESWGTVRHTPGVTGFVGNAHNPVPLSLSEVFSMLEHTIVHTDAESGKPVQPQFTPATVNFEIGESVTVNEGPFETLPASISEIKHESRQPGGARVDLRARDPGDALLQPGHQDPVKLRRHPACLAGERRQAITP